MTYCDRKLIGDYLANQLEIDTKLEFLFHLDDCSQCWGEVYNSVKARHPNFYKSSNRKMKISERELEKLESSARQEVFEVA